MGTTCDSTSGYVRPAEVTPARDNPSSTEESNEVTIQAKQDDTLDEIARRYGVSTPKIKEANPDLPGGDEPIAPGTEVAIPVNQADGDGASTYPVEKTGETLSDVAESEGVEASALADANGLPNTDEPLERGTELIVPNAKALSTEEAAQLEGVPGAENLGAK